MKAIWLAWRSVFVGLLLSTGVFAAVPSAQLVQDPDTNGVVAWVRFTQASQQFEGVPYYWLGDGELNVAFNVRPEAGHALELLWGAKNDERGAILELNGMPVQVQAGGYFGYRWVRVPLPEVKGEKYEIRFRSGRERPAFLAEARLIDSKQNQVHYLKAAMHQAELRQVPGGAVAAQGPTIFDEMRRFWDREPEQAQKSEWAKFNAGSVEAERNARQAGESLFRCLRFVEGWLAVADPASGLIPENLGRGRDQWNGRNNAADNYPFMVLTCALTDRELFDGRMSQMLRTEIKLTRRLDRLGDWYQFSKRGFKYDEVDLDRLVFDNAEYVKDGLIPLTEWLGPSPWSERMIGLIEDIWKHAPVETPFGKIPTLNFEVNGDLLQACSRLFWFTGEQKYLDWALRLGDFYLLSTNHPTRNAEMLRLGDHSCEVINGLSELYVIVAQELPEKREAYREPLHELYDRILEIGINEHGMMYRQVNTRTGEHGDTLTDNWGYNYDGLYTAWLLDGTAAYRDAVRHALSNVKAHYSNHPWENGSADGYADSIEGAITLLNREYVASAAAWIDSETRVMWSKQRGDGIIEGWHGDGNSARTSIMYALWKTQGIHVEPWRPDLRVGAVRKGDELCVFLAADKPWKGRVLFDRPRHKDYMRLPMDYPRINQFPEWFTVQAGTIYELVQADGTTSRRKGSELTRGLRVSLAAGEPQLWVVKEQR